MAGRKNTTKRLLVSGAVQGVGFRPFVYREALRLHLIGWIRNTSGGVEIMVSGDDSAVSSLVNALHHHAPPAAMIDHIEITDGFLPDDTTGFSITDSKHDGIKRVRVLSDLATCSDCLREIRDPNNLRYRYPFTNCTACGPRYSIMHRLPYDRDHTTMRTFTMCPSCRHEYDDPSDRRFHAQPNACPVCGPQLAYWDRSGRVLAERNDAILEAALCLINGGIVAIKGIGGFHVMVDATNEAAVKILRERKRRAEKPFAVMMKDVATAEHYADIQPMEATWLNARAAPIVIVRKKPSDIAASVAPDNPNLGIMLPYAPLHHLLMDEVKRPLVATSGNLSDEPICIDEYEALERLGGIADFFLVHNRPIAHPIDDSIMRVVLGRPLWLRVARGMSPVALPRPEHTGGESILAVGPHMKSTLAIVNTDHIVVSPHIGDLETIPAWESFERNLETLEGLYEVKPTIVACDLHPDYASTHYARRRTMKPMHVQHHHAHILSVMAEYELNGPVLGFAFDGTGFGDDGTIWGGEVLRVDRHGYQRIAHLRTFPLPGGDAAAREPRRSALGVLFEMQAEACTTNEGGFTAGERSVLTKAIAKNINTTRTSSMGRIFDAAASLLGLCQQSSFEGQAAMLLQAEAEKADSDTTSYPITIHEGERLILDWAPIITGLITDREAGVPTPVIAARVHRSIVTIIVEVAGRFPELPLVLSGGCFQNALLLEETVNRLHPRPVFWPRILPPNDGGISAGQALYCCWNTHP